MTQISGLTVNGSIPIKANSITGSLLVEVTSGNPGGSGTADTLESTQILVKNAVQSILVRSLGHSATVSITRPSNATPYTALDVIGDTSGSAILEFASMGVAGGEVRITSVELEIDAASVPSGMLGFNLRLYNAAPTAVADNAAWDLVAGDRGKYIGKVLLGTPVDEGSTLFIDNDSVNKQIKLSTTSLFVMLQTIGGFTPTSAMVKRLTIHTTEV